MPREPEPMDPIADARNEAVAVAAFSAWWGPQAARMHWAREAAPRSRLWQGPPYYAICGRSLRLTAEERLLRIRRAHLATYLVRKARRRDGV